MIILTAHGGLEAATEATEHGAFAYIEKSESTFEILPKQVKSAVDEQERINSHAKIANEIEVLKQLVTELSDRLNSVTEKISRTKS